MPRSFTRAALLLRPHGRLVVAACGGSAGIREEAKETLRERQAALQRAGERRAAHLLRQRPARRGRQARADVRRPAAQQRRRQAPRASTGRSPSAGLTTKFTSRAVSTGDNFFINLGGQDFEAGRRRSPSSPPRRAPRKQKGLAPSGFDPLGAVKDVKKADRRRSPAPRRPATRAPSTSTRRWTSTSASASRCPPRAPPRRCRRAA